MAVQRPRPLVMSANTLQRRSASSVARRFIQGAAVARNLFRPRLTDRATNGVHRTRKRKSQPIARGTETGITDRQSKYLKPTKKSSKKASFKKIKKVKITRDFKAKVNKALAPSKNYGTVQTVNYDLIKNTTNYAQSVYMMPYTNWYVGTFGVGQQGVHFSPMEFNHYASVLWNSKTASTSGILSWNDANNLQGIETTGDILKMKVVNSFKVFKFRNNTQRTYTLRIYDCKPKRILPDPQNENPLNTWTNALNTDSLPDTGLNGTLPSASINVTDQLPSTYWTEPTVSAQFRSAWDTSKTTIVIEPGQSAEYILQGPKDLMLDYSKFVKNTDMFNMQKFCRYCMIVATLDLVVVTGVAVPAIGRYGQSPFSITAPEAVCVEIMTHVKLEMPDVIGGQGVAVGARLNLAGRTSKYMYETIAYPVSGPGPFSQPVNRVDDENPALTTASG